MIADDEPTPEEVAELRRVRAALTPERRALWMRAGILLLNDWPVWKVQAWIARELAWLRRGGR